MRGILLLMLVAMATAKLAPLLTHLDSIPESYIVKLKEGYIVDSFLADFGSIKPVHKFSKVFTGFSARLTEDLVDRLRAMEAVEFVEENGVMRTTSVASWGLDRIDQISLPLDDTYNQVLGTGAGVHVYVLDTGINIGHEDYAGRSFIAFDARGGTGDDCNGHGSHCSGTIAGTDYGVAKQANVYGVRVLGCLGSGSYDDIISGCDWVAANATFPAVASMSLGGSASSSVDLAVQGMIDVGITVSVSAGNDDRDACSKSPARVGDAITVGATDDTDTRAYFSNFGFCVDIFGPGVDITSAWIGGSNATNTISGTSMSCPHVAGSAAVLLEGDPSMTPYDVKTTLQTKAIAGAVNDPETNSPNLLLYIGTGSGGGFVPTIPPTTPAPPTTLPPPIPGCGGYFNDSTGIFTSPGYPNDYPNYISCEYIFVAPTVREIVAVSFLDFYLEGPSHCPYDRLTAYDGANDTAPVIGEWCSTTSPGNITSTGNAMFIHFESDFSVNYRGFQAEYNIVETGECGHTFTAKAGLFTSPNYPGNYGNHDKCDVTIVGKPGDTVTLSFSDFDVEGHVSCGYDQVEVYDGDNEWGDRLAVLCGHEIPSPVKSISNSMFVRFVSDGSMNYRGFSAKYIIE